MSESKMRSDSWIFMRKTGKLLFLPVLLMLVGIVFYNPGIVIAGDDDQATAKLWQKIQSAEYQKNWALFPGKGKLYEGTEPHGMLLTTYVNPTAESGLTSGAKELEKGSILIKENYMPDEKLAAVTVMEKTGDGKDDWFWVKYNPDGTVATMDMDKDGKTVQVPVAGGMKTMCATCHAASTAGIHNIMTAISE